MRVKSFLADLIAMNTFFFVVNMTNEVFIAGIPLEKSLKLRLVAIVTNTLTAYPYSCWLKIINNRLFINQKGFAKSYLCDTLAFFSFQLPLYLVNMALVKIPDIHQIVTASLSIGLMAGILGWPYAQYLYLVKKLFGVKVENTNKIV